MNEISSIYENRYVSDFPKTGKFAESKVLIGNKDLNLYRIPEDYCMIMGNIKITSAFVMTRSSTLEILMNYDNSWLVVSRCGEIFLEQFEILEEPKKSWFGKMKDWFSIKSIEQSHE